MPPANRTKGPTAAAVSWARAMESAEVFHVMVDVLKVSTTADSDREAEEKPPAKKAVSATEADTM
jgi:hypothetical protein